jgi:CBS domain-containing protein
VLPRGLSLVRDIMVPCRAYVNPRDLVTHARSLMRSTGVRVLPVVEEGRVEGILTDREALKVGATKSGVLVLGLMLPPQNLLLPHDPVGRAVERMVTSEILELPVIQSWSDRRLLGMASATAFLGAISLRGKVEEFMEEAEVTEPEEGINRVWERMEKVGCSGMAVVRKRGGKTEVVGIITRYDLIRSGRLEGAVAKVRSCMKSPAITVAPSLEIGEALSLMGKHGISHLPVVEGGNLAGMLTKLSVLRRWVRENR